MCQTSLRSEWERSGILIGKGNMSPITSLSWQCLVGCVSASNTHLHTLIVAARRLGNKRKNPQNLEAILNPSKHAHMYRHMAFEWKCQTVWRSYFALKCVTAGLFGLLKKSDVTALSIHCICGFAWSDLQKIYTFVHSLSHTYTHTTTKWKYCSSQVMRLIWGTIVHNG